MADNDEPRAAAGGAGLGEDDLACDGDIFLRDSDQASDRQLIDPHLAVLLRAACLFDLVEAGELTPLQAFGRLQRAIDIISPCQCSCETLDAFERYDCERRRRGSGRRPPPRDPFALPPPNWLTMPFGSLWHFFNERRERYRLLNERREQQRRSRPFKQTNGGQS
jgi:hypothetical protein